MPGFELIGKEERDEVNSVFDSGGVLMRHAFDAKRNNTYKVKEFESEFSKKMGVKYSLAVTSGTSALRVALASLDIGEGDEVITQSFTFVATVEAIIESRAIPICTEVDATLNMDPEDLLRRITPKTKAVIVVHMLGTPARLEEIQKICVDKGIILIEDTAWGCGGNLKGKPLGTWGRIGTFSFDFAKTMTTGEGGMIVFQNQEDYEKAFAWHDHGHENNPKVPRWEDTRSGSGFNYRMMELQGAVGLAQLKKLDGIVQSQRANKAKLIQLLEGIPGIKLRELPEGSYDTADALVFMVETNELAKKIRGKLLEIGISTKILPEAVTWHFAGTWNHMPELVSSHSEPLEKAFPKTMELLSRSVSLPIFVNMEDQMINKVADCIQSTINTF
ncbi:MAG: DegT/DnrJ/EryC1/StrS family aminotransferase [Leptospira sp.]|nr:DegT/DnrJ/EryC1/StrS family aminotransferase [Leptospira sp.]